VTNHSHCPLGCDHPQPFKAMVAKQTAEWFYLDPSVLYEFCGRCWHRDGELEVMVPCTPEICD